MPKLLVFNLFALLVLVIQFFTGFFIEPEMQVIVLTTANGIFRAFVGRDLISGEIRSVVDSAYEFTCKTIWESKLFWLSVLGVIGAAAQWRFGWVIDPKYYLTVISAVATMIAAITKKPVKLK